ncbi:antitoxin HicB [Aedoeadaptatus coli]|uniref:antitoxin HicB n=1 Tax=Aedoeadaptatus coli TaxID=2058292 RepID=UPI000D560C54|nr:antitoxin HicB [Peptoniphilus coli]
MKLMKYKDYIGSIEYSEEDKMFFGEIQGIDSIVGYGGETISELEEMFRESVDEFVGDK